MMTQLVVTKQLSFIFLTICEETRTNPLSEMTQSVIAKQ